MLLAAEDSNPVLLKATEGGYMLFRLPHCHWALIIITYYNMSSYVFSKPGSACMNGGPPWAFGMFLGMFYGISLRNQSMFPLRVRHHASSSGRLHDFHWFPLAPLSPVSSFFRCEYDLWISLTWFDTISIHVGWLALEQVDFHAGHGGASDKSKSMREQAEDSSRNLK